MFNFFFENYRSQTKKNKGKARNDGIQPNQEEFGRKKVRELGRRDKLSKSWCGSVEVQIEEDEEYQL